MCRLFEIIFASALLVGITFGQCPDKDPDLVPWDPISDSTQDVVISGQKWLLTGTNVTLRSITIQSSGKLVISDDGQARQLRVRHILITSNGELWIGSDTCPYQSDLDIVLQGRSDATDIGEQPIFGRKFIGVAPTGSLVIYGGNKMSWTNLQTTINPGSSITVVELADIAVNWLPGDRVVVASSDYDMNHAEEFTLGDCPTCNFKQVLLQETAEYKHLGEFSAHGVDMRAEIGMLTHNIRIHGEMEPSCYGSNFCQFFDYDTYGGHIQMLSGFKRADFFGVELYHMGQQLLGKYPIHYHVVGPVYGSYVRHVSVHHCFSRCVTLHGSEGLTVQDVVGYDTLGHCFFLEDGNEQNNFLIHNLGLVTKPGTLLPSDRDQRMCETMLDNVYPGYIPNADVECRGASTFWIAHPNNTLRNNSAAGSVDYGFFFIFHRTPTGPSAGTLPPFHGERTTIAAFHTNTAHSNREDGFLMDRGVKVDQASQADPREFLALSDYARYMPHRDQDPLSDYETAYIDYLTSYKNHRGAVVRGGSVGIYDSKFSDNDVAVVLMSNDLLPHDQGVFQHLRYSVIAATSDPSDEEWLARSYPSVGIQLSGGPGYIYGNQFYGYTSATGREAYAVGFVPQFNGQFGTTTKFEQNTFYLDKANRLYFGRQDPSSIHGSYDFDGDLNQIVFDYSGDLSGYPNAHIVRSDNQFLNYSTCMSDPSMNGVACPGTSYGQLFVNATTKTANMTIQRQRPFPPNYSLTLQGANKADTVNYPDTTQYQAVLVDGNDYVISFNEETPNWIELSSYNLQWLGHITVGIDFKGVTPTFTGINYIEWKQMSNTVTVDRPLTMGASRDEVDRDGDGYTYYFDTETTILWVKLVNHYHNNGYCPDEGCQFIRVQST